jgi:hypothetical protein
MKQHKPKSVDWNPIDSTIERRRRHEERERVQKAIERNIALECQNPIDSRLLFWAGKLVEHMSAVTDGYSGEAV